MLTNTTFCYIIFFMKTLLTVTVCAAQKEAPACDGIEFIIIEENESERDFLSRAAKSAKGKYVVISDRSVSVADVQSLLNIIDKNTADMVCFTVGMAVKTSYFKNAVKDCADTFSLKSLCVLSCKNLLKTIYMPFTFGRASVQFNGDNTEGLLLAAETFGKVKSKLTKEIYSYASNLLCDRLVTYYMYSMLEIKSGKTTADKLIAFDGKLKAEIVLYLALEKRFTAAKLEKLRAKAFRISPLTARKFKKLLK